MATRIAKAGFFGGDPQKVLSARADVVLNILQFELFESDYQREFTRLTREADA